jgi:hypothetical protein
MKKLFGVLTITLVILGAVGLAFGLSAYRDELISGRWTFQNPVSFLGDITTGGTLTLNGVEYTWPAADGTAGYQITTDGAGTLSWAAAGAGCPWDDLTPPDANESLDHTAFWTAWDFGDTDHDMFNIIGSDDFGDVSIVKIEQSTGDPTDGTVLEVVSADTDTDALIVTANSINSIAVAGSGNVTITGGTGVIDYTDFDVSADGAVTIASDADNTMITLNPSIATTLAIDATAANIVTALSVGANDIIGTTGLINYTNFDVDAAGAVVCTALDAGAGTIETTGDLTVTGTANIGTLEMDNLVAATAATTITLNGTGAGGVTIGGVSTGDITLGADGAGSTLVNLPNTVDMTISGGDFSVTDTANADMVTFTNNTLTTGDLLTLSAAGVRTSNFMIAITDAATTASTIDITADSQTSGNGIQYGNASALLTGAAIDLDVNDGVGFTGDFIRCHDAGAEDFTVERYGEVTITGAADADMLTITAGNFEMTDGDIDVNDGFIAINTDEDHASYITRALAAAGSGPAFTVTDSNAATTQPSMTIASGGTACTGALTIDQTGTGNSTGIDLNVAGDLPAIDIDASAARDGDAIDIAMANMLDERAINISGAITAAAGEGTIEVHSTGQIAATGSLLRLDNDTAKAADGSSGYILNIDDDTTVADTPVVYAALIDSNVNGALHISKGVSLFADAVTFTAQSVHTGGVNADGDVDIDLSDNTEEVSIETTAQDFAAGSGLVQIHGDHAGNTTGDMALLRLVYQGDGIANDTYIEGVDASTGAAGNGNTMWKIGANGNILTEGTLTVNGAQIVGDGATEMVGVINDVVDGAAANPYTVTVAMSGTVFYNSQAIEFDLPDAATGLEYTFVVGHASNLDVDPAAGDTINYITCGAGDKVRSATVGDTITLIGTDAGNWFVKAIVAGDGDFTDSVWTDAGP